MRPRPNSDIPSNQNSEKLLRSPDLGELVEKWLARAPIRMDRPRIRECIEGRNLLITGAAGSIGSELSREIARYQPGVLILFDQAESDLFGLHQEICRQHPRLDVVPLIGDIRDSGSVEAAMAVHEVDSVYHAAAYKHVPLMEDHVVEVVRNNIIGTWHLLRAARSHGVSDFLMISTDKAERPLSVMGLTKRIAEIVVAAHSESNSDSWRFTSVRLGNVLGSSGSVVPIFQEQIAAGGPVTVTDADAFRYFMSVGEAVSLALETSAMGQGAEVFVCEMGKPVRILDLARTMIRLSDPDSTREIEILFTGLRRGEKLVEDVPTQGPVIAPSPNEKIHVLTAPPIGFDLILVWLNALESLIEQRDSDSILAHLTALVPEFGAPRPTALPDTFQTQN